MTMAERLTQTEIQTIVIKEAVPVPDGTLINGVVKAPIPFQKIQEYQDVAETTNACVCHIVGEHRICANPAGTEVPIEPAVVEPVISLSNGESTLPYGVLVKDPQVAKTLMDEAALSQLSLLESAKVSSLDLDNQLNKMVNQIEDVTQRLHTPGKAKSARHEALQIIKRAELPTAILTSAVIFAANKVGS